MFEVLVSHEAEKFYKKQDPAIKKKINKSIEIISDAPFYGPRIKRLHGKLEGKYRYDVGGIRIIGLDHRFGHCSMTNLLSENRNGWLWPSILNGGLKALRYIWPKR